MTGASMKSTFCVMSLLLWQASVAAAGPVNLRRTHVVRVFEQNRDAVEAGVQADLFLIRNGRLGRVRVALRGSA